MFAIESVWYFHPFILNLGPVWPRCVASESQREVRVMPGGPVDGSVTTVPGDMSTTDSLDSGQTLQRTPAPSDLQAKAIPRGDERYDAIGTLGEGGMGRVLEAIDRQFGRVVALKELRGPGGDSARLEAEAMVTGSLEHPGIPAVYERGLKADGTPWYAMRRVRGRSLEAALQEAQGVAGRLTLLGAVTRAAETLGFAHEKGVVHRDVKPENIMVGTHGEVFVVDWGLARSGHRANSGTGSTDSTGGVQRTLAGAVMGTPAYMAPEQARGDGQMVDARTDVFALGAVLYRLLTGRAPYEAESTGRAVELAVACEFPSVDVLAPDAPPPLRAICQKAMAARPEERFPTAQHLADALDTFASTAVSRAYERTAGRTTIAALGFGVFVSLLGLVGVVRLAELQYLLAPNLFIALTFTGLSWWLAWLELRSNGRLGLAPMGFSMAACIFLTAFIAVGFAVLTRTEPTEVIKQSGVALAFDGLLTAASLGVWGIVTFKRAR